MVTSQMTQVVQHLRLSALQRDGAGLTDEQLLRAYLAHREEEALAVLVLRHGPMVWGVCRRVLRNDADAEDAFQATFLVLVRRAASIASPALLANWLYGVAHKTALKARATAGRRFARERQVSDMPEPAVTQPDRGDELQALLDQELSRLPDIYRAAIVLCELEGLSRREAAGHLGVPEGTLAARLSRGRALLAERLARQGVPLSAGALAAALSQGAASAAVVSATVKAASGYITGQAAGLISAKVAALTEGVLKGMLLSKLKGTVVLLIALTALGFGATALLHRTRADDTPTRARIRAEPAVADREPTVLSTEGGVRHVAWGAGGKTIGVVSSSPITGLGVSSTAFAVQLWDAQRGRLRLTLPADERTIIDRIVFSPDGRLVAVNARGGALSRQEIRLFDAATGKEKQRIEFNGLLTGIAFSPDGKALAYGGRGRGTLRWSDAGPRFYDLRVWDLGKHRMRLERAREIKPDVGPGYGLSLAFSPDGKTLLTGGDDPDGKITLWDLAKGERVRTFEGHAVTVRGREAVFHVAIALSPDGKTLVSGSNQDTRVKLWDVATGKLKQTLEGNKGWIAAVAFSADGKHIVTSGGADGGGEVIVWDGPSGKRLRTLPVTGTGVPTVAISPDGKTLAVGSDAGRKGEVKLWRLDALPGDKE
jgi:RNA polymerase sigma factor (sigma-70 family)